MNLRCYELIKCVSKIKVQLHVWQSKILQKKYHKSLPLGALELRIKDNKKPAAIIEPPQVTQ